MAETKRNMIHRVRHMAMVLAHGTYASEEGFTVPDGKVIIFVSRTARYLPQSVVDTDFYNVFSRMERIRSILKNSNSRPPSFLREWYNRTYGPGDFCPNLTLEMNDPAWGMGIHSLPLVRNQLRTTRGVFYGRKMKLGDLVSQISGTGILFVTACRSTTGMPNTYANISTRYNFPVWSLEHRLQVQNMISSRMRKRRREGSATRLATNRSPVRSPKRRRINNR